MRGLSAVPQPYTPASTDLNLNDVIDAIRNTDPNTFQDFQAAAAAAAAQGMSASFPPAGNVGAVVKALDSSKAKKQAYVKITEQPASKGLRFRYECEGRSAGSIPGTSSTAETKTFPTIQVVGYRGRAVVVVSVVTMDQPYRPHPHNLVGKEGCKKGVCTIELDSDTMSCSFPSLGIQCVKKKEIEESLKLRQQIRVDPFQTGFAHKDNPQTIDLNCVRLCFQVFLEGSEKGAFTFALKPVVSDPIYDKKARSDLTICRMTDCSASVAGGKEILLFCEKVTKDDIQVRLYEEKGGHAVWEGFGDFQPSDVHKQYGICFRTPRYHNLEAEEIVHAYIQLRRPSDGAVSDSRPFQLTPIDGGRGFWAAKRLKTNYTIFNNILSADPLRNNNNHMIGVATGIAPAEEPRRKLAGHKLSSPLMSPDSSTHHHHHVAAVPLPTQPIQLVHASTFPTPPPPIRNFATSTITCPTPDLPPPPTPLPTAHNNNNDMLRIPPKAANMDLRPLSEVSVTDSASTTRQSVNEILSLASLEGENKSIFTLDTVAVPDQPVENVSVQTLMAKPDQQKQVELQLALKNPVVELTGKSADMLLVVKNEEQSTDKHDNPMEIDVQALYDDVMQCVYDDVDTKYDGMDFTTNEEPPVPPARKKMPPTTVTNTVPPTPVVVDEEPLKPLPDTPSKMPALIGKLAEKKLAKDKDKDNKKKEQDELKKKEKAKEKEEKEKLKNEKKRKQEEEKKAKRSSEITDENKSIFQRLFHRSKSLEQAAAAVKEELSDPTAVGAPPIPPHKDGNGNDAHEDFQLDENSADLKELQDFIDSGNLDQLDNMVSEFAKDYMPDTMNNSTEDKNKNCADIDNNSSQQQV